MARFKSTLERQNVYKIAGFDVQFPMKPYGPQFTFMHKMLTTLELSKTSSSANALLESPTGTGKSLALLCAALAWQQHCKQHGCPPPVPAASGTEDGADPQAAMQGGGGFLPGEVGLQNLERWVKGGNSGPKQSPKRCVRVKVAL